MTARVWAELAFLCLVACALANLAYRSIWSTRLTPLQRERRRREMINRIGRTHDGFLTDVRPNLLVYSYSVNGVDYNASQDIADLAGLVPDNLADLIGHVNLKYAPRNPANSILICEQWSGLRTSPQYRRSQ